MQQGTKIAVVVLAIALVADRFDLFDEGQRYCTAHSRGDSDPDSGTDLDA